MRRGLFLALLCCAGGLVSACLSGCVLEKSSDGADAGGRDGGVGEAGVTVTGAGCGAERQTGTQLCIATSQCPNVVVDTQAMPSCGFRIRGSVADLVCACGTSICPMGIYTTCQQAAKLLTSQTEQQVCVQVNEGRCVDAPAQDAGKTSGTGTKQPCDRECMAQCGGGAACASVCNCS
jgi:hypothetical protein